MKQQKKHKAPGYTDLFLDTLKYRLGLIPRTEYDINEEFFSSISTETAGI